MAIITPGVAATITAASAEGQAFQLLQWWQLQEENLLINPTQSEYFTGSKSTDTGNKFFEGTWKIPASFAAEDPITISAKQLYQGLTFTPGSTPGTFTATSPTAYTLQVLLWLINRESDSSFNPDRISNITAKYDANSGMYEGTFKLPYITTLLENGGTQDSARPYLL
jgi:hypothetical protein